MRCLDLSGSRARVPICRVPSAELAVVFEYTHQEIVGMPEVLTVVANPVAPYFALEETVAILAWRIYFGMIGPD